MNNRYAVVEVATSLVSNVIIWDGISEWAPDEGFIVVASEEAQIGYTYADGVFTAPPVPPPTEAELLAAQSFKLQQATQLAAAQKAALVNRVGTLNDAIELEISTPEEEAELPVRMLQLKAWKTYAILLGRVTAQAGWYATVEWPIQPAEGMDLTVSGRSAETV